MKRKNKKTKVKSAAEKSGSGKYAELVAPKLEFIRSLSASGLTEGEIAEKLGVSRQSLSAYKKKYEPLRIALSTGREDCCSSIKAVLYKRAIGFNYVETRTKPNKDGVLEEEVMQKYCPPDVKAAEILLRQWDPEYREKASESPDKPIQILLPTEVEKWAD